MNLKPSVEVMKMWILSAVSMVIVANCNAAGCSSCRNVQIRVLEDGGNFSSNFTLAIDELGAPYPSTAEGRLFEAPVGTSCEVSLVANTGSCQAPKAILSAKCGAILFYKKKREEEPYWPILWERSTGGMVITGNIIQKSTEGGKHGRCDHANCVGGEQCQCSCHQAEQTIMVPYYKAYFRMAYTVHQIVEESERDYYSTHPLFLGWADPLTVWLRDPDGNKVKVDADSRHDNPQSTDILFAGWDPESEEMETEQIPAILCNCPMDDESGGGSTVPAPGNTRQEICVPGKPQTYMVMAWHPPTSNKNRLGQSDPSTTYGGGGSFAGGEEPNLKISFGLGKDAAAGAWSRFEFSSDLDAASPLAAQNFKLVQPFHSGSSGPYQLLYNQPDGAIVTGGGVKVIEDRSVEGVVKLSFIDHESSASPVLKSEHIIQHIPGDAQGDPGIRHEERLNGLLRISEYRGSSDGAGGRSWSEVSPDGRIEEGLETPFAGQPQERTRQLTIKQKKTDGSEVMVRQTTEIIRKFVWGERLVEKREMTIGNDESITSYEYYHDEGSQKRGMLKWCRYPDGSWEKFDYDDHGFRTKIYRPWLSQVSHPDAANDDNCRVSTFTRVVQGNHWCFETILGKVVSREWNHRESVTGDPLLQPSGWGGGIPRWVATNFESNDIVEVAGGVTVVGDSACKLVTVSPAGIEREVILDKSPGNIVRALEVLLDAGVAHDAPGGQYIASSKNSPAGFRVVPEMDYMRQVRLKKKVVTQPAKPGKTTIEFGGFYMGGWRLEHPFLGYYEFPQNVVSSEELASAVASQLGGIVDPDNVGNYNRVLVIQESQYAPFTLFGWDITQPSPVLYFDNEGPSQGVYTWVDAGVINWRSTTSTNDAQGNGQPLTTQLLGGSSDQAHLLERSQKFTADYAAWTGSMTVTNEHGVQYSLSSDGRLTQYVRDKGVYDHANRAFEWTGQGEASKITTRSFAINAATLQVLAEEPLFIIAMNDHDGVSRNEETWHGVDRVAQTVHDYDSGTLDLVSSLVNGIPVFSGLRDMQANSYTSTDSSGVVTVHKYKGDGTLGETRKIGHESRADVVSRTVEEGSITSSMVDAGGLRRRSSRTVDALGQVISSTDEDGLVTLFTYESGGRRVVTHLPNGGTRIVERYLDGQLKSVKGTAVTPVFHEYTIDDGGNIAHTTYLNDDGDGQTRSPRWHRTVTNGIGQLIKEETPSSGGGGVSIEHFYDSRGLKVITRQSGRKDLLFEYDAFGRLTREGMDINGNGALDLAQHEPVTSTAHDYVKLGGQWWERTTVTQHGMVPRTRTTRTLLGGTIYEATVTEDSDGLVVTDMTVRNPQAKTVVRTRTSNRSELMDIQTTVNGLVTSSGSLTGTGVTSYDYDPLERPTVVTTADGLSRKTVYDDEVDPVDGQAMLARSRLKKSQVRSAGAAADAFFDVESYTYHPGGSAGAGQVHVTTRADGSTITQSYDLHGRPVFVSGTGAYPVRYQYNEYGELWKMHTFRTGTPTEDSVGDVTTWERDSGSGALLSKTDALNHGTLHTYDPVTGRLLSRAWARSVGGQRVTASYGYDDAGRLTSISYNDGTPGVTHVYHPDGRLKTSEDAAGLKTYQYLGPNGALSKEVYGGTGLLSGASVSHSYDELLRRDELSWDWGSQSRSTVFGHDAAGRLQTVSAFGQTATYGYAGSTGQMVTLGYTGVGALTGEWEHDERGRLDVVRWVQQNGQVVSKHDYGYASPMNRRTSALRETGDEWRYSYNLRGEVESAEKAQGSDSSAPLWRGLANGYAYDGIGNRVEEDVDTPAGVQTQAWTSNAANQITERQQARGRWVLGRVHPEATLNVTGVGGAVVRSGEDFAVPVEAGGTAEEAAWKALSIQASRTGVGVNGGDVQRTREGRLWFAGSPESLAYDEDGNLTSDGRWTYAWDAENRLKSMETQSAAISAGVPAQRLEFAYDAQGRRVRKVVRSLSASGWVVTSDLRYLYDGWNLIAELEKSARLPAPAPPRLLRAYAWGRDLSGTEQGAGGVGGLVLAEQRRSMTTTGGGQPTSSTLAPTYDGNGNISAYVDLTSGRVTARLDYDAFGKPVWSDVGDTTGARSRIPFGFSTKYEDPETGVLYYGFRYYSPELGRWPSRDPIEEEGGINLYGMVGNDAVNRWDYLGMEWHHLLSRGIFTPEFLQAHGITGLDIHDPKYGWELDFRVHRGKDGSIHSAGWNADWKAWIQKELKEGRKIDICSIEKQLEVMKGKYKSFLDLGSPVSGRYKKVNYGGMIKGVGVTSGIVLASLLAGEMTGTNAEKAEEINRALVAYANANDEFTKANQAAVVALGLSELTGAHPNLVFAAFLNNENEFR